VFLTNLFGFAVPASLTVLLLTEVTFVACVALEACVTLPCDTYVELAD